jgi:FAD/FMN-containing dehydrogenase
MTETIKPNHASEARELPLPQLRAEVSGAVYAPLDEGYDAARATWNLTIQQHPLVVVMAESEADVQVAVRFAATHGLPIGVQATGHGLPRGCDGGVLINLSRMKSVSVDAEARTAAVQGGAQWQDVLTPAGALGLAGLCGSAPHVGVVGYTLGGGYGVLLRKHGLAIDAVVSMRVVTADGEARLASRDSNADLYWAILGGGGAFGVVTEMEIRLFPQAQVFGGTIFYPIELAEKALTTFAEWTQDLPDEVTSSISIMNLPPLPIVPPPLQGKAVVAFTATVCGDIAAAEDLLTRMRTLGEPILDAFAPLPFAACGAIYRDPVDPMPAIGNGVLLRDLSAASARTFLESLGPVEKMPTLKAEIRHLGGAMARVAHGASAIGSRREAGYLMFMLGIPNPFASPEAIEAHAEATFTAMGDAVLCRGPLNWIGEGQVRKETMRDVFSDETHVRLAETKNAVDPENRFRFAGIGII